MTEDWLFVYMRHRKDRKEVVIFRITKFQGTMEEAKIYAKLWTRNNDTSIDGIFKTSRQILLVKKIRYYQKEYSRLMKEIQEAFRDKESERWRQEVREEKKVFYQGIVKKLGQEMKNEGEFYLFKNLKSLGK